MDISQIITQMVVLFLMMGTGYRCGKLNIIDSDFLQKADKSYFDNHNAGNDYCLGCRGHRHRKICCHTDNRHKSAAFCHIYSTGIFGCKIAPCAERRF